MFSDLVDRRLFGQALQQQDVQQQDVAAAAMAESAAKDESQEAKTHADHEKVEVIALACSLTDRDIHEAHKRCA